MKYYNYLVLFNITYSVMLTKCTKIFCYKVILFYFKKCLLVTTNFVLNFFYKFQFFFAYFVTFLFCYTPNFFWWFCALWILRFVLCTFYFVFSTLYFLLWIFYFEFSTLYFLLCTLCFVLCAILYVVWCCTVWCYMF
jgi:hypothetical protein